MNFQPEILAKSLAKLHFASRIFPNKANFNETLCRKISKSLNISPRNNPCICMNVDLIYVSQELMSCLLLEINPKEMIACILLHKIHTTKYFLGRKNPLSSKKYLWVLTGITSHRYWGECNDYIGESSKFPKSWTFQTPILKLAICPLNIHNFKFKWSIVYRHTEDKSENLL